jgi:hypothetical protein
MSLTRKSREFVADYAKDRVVSIVDSAKSPTSLALVVLKLLQKTKNTSGHLNPK